MSYYRGDTTRTRTVRRRSTRRTRRSAPRTRRARRRRSSPRVTATIRKVARYNPETGRRVMVASDSVEAAEWPTRKPARSQMSTRARREAGKLAERAVGQSLRAVARPETRAALRTRAGAVARGAGRLAAKASLVAAAFAIGYGIGEGMKYVWRRLQPQERAYRAALAFKRARDTFTREHGRAPNAEEVRQLSQGFREALARLGR